MPKKKRPKKKKTKLKKTDKKLPFLVDGKKVFALEDGVRVRITENGKAMPFADLLIKLERDKLQVRQTTSGEVTRDYKEILECETVKEQM